VDNLEVEFTENIFDCLNYVLLEPSNVWWFGWPQVQGIDIMIRII